MPADQTDLLSPTARDRFSAVIDVRSPAEFADDHIPGAINLPVLDDAQRAEIGALYVQVSKFEAKKIGAALVAQNIAKALQGPLADKPADFAPLVYCWRGGQRSGAMATVLKQIGWRVETLKGGYKSHRRRVLERLYQRAPEHNIVILDGDTGAAKTEILGRLAARGAQALDLEDLAAHRGSLFGAEPERPQPGQKLFESRLLDLLDRFDPHKPILIEAESNKIGARVVPPYLWRAMALAPRIALDAPRAARARYLLSTYAHLSKDRDRLDAGLDRLIRLHGHDQVAVWRSLAAQGEHLALAEDLLERHYDPSYERSRKKRGRATLATIDAGDLTAADQESAADAILAALDAQADAAPLASTGS